MLNYSNQNQHQLITQSSMLNETNLHNKPNCDYGSKFKLILDHIGNKQTPIPTKQAMHMLI